MGVNTPASSVVIAGLEHSGGSPYSVAEYKNLIGRAGRLGYAEHGTSYLVAMNSRDAEDLWLRYIIAKPENLQSRFLDTETDPRSLIVRVLVAGGRPRGAARTGMMAEEIASFLEASFGAFQEQLRIGRWNWSHDDLLAAVADLAHHGLIDAHTDGRYELTPLGRLAGESGVEVSSVVRLVDCFKGLSPDQISDPALITVVQVTRELDQVNIPLNKKTPKEAQSWFQVLTNQGVPGYILRCLGRDVREQHDQAARAKRAVAALAYISGQEMNAIEQLLKQHGGGFDGASGPIRNASTRTCDLLGVAAQVAGIIHPGLDFGGRIERLNLRLTLGIPGPMVELARYAGNRLTRGDYRRLHAAQLHSCESVSITQDEMLLACLDGDRQRLTILRAAAESLAAELEHARNQPPLPQLEQYVA